MPLRLYAMLGAAAVLLVAGVAVLAWPRIDRARVVAAVPGAACLAVGSPVRYLGAAVGRVDRVEPRPGGAAVVTLALSRRDLPLTRGDLARTVPGGPTEYDAVEIVRAPGAAPALDPRRDTLAGAAPAPEDPRAAAVSRQLRAQGVEFRGPCRR